MQLPAQPVSSCKGYIIPWDDILAFDIDVCHDDTYDFTI